MHKKGNYCILQENGKPKKRQSENGHLMIADILLQYNAILITKTVFPDDPLRLEKFFKVKILTRIQWSEDGGQFLNKMQVWQPSSKLKSSHSSKLQLGKRTKMDTRGKFAILRPSASSGNAKIH